MAKKKQDDSLLLAGRSKLMQGFQQRLAKAKVKGVKDAEFDVMYGKGISRVGELLDLAVKLDIVQKSGAWFSYNGERLAQGKDNARKAIASNPSLMKELEEKIKSKGDEIDLGAGEAYSLEEDDEGESDDFDIRLIDIEGED